MFCSPSICATLEMTFLRILGSTKNIKLTLVFEDLRRFRYAWKPLIVYNLSKVRPSTWTKMRLFRLIHTVNDGIFRNSI